MLICGTQRTSRRFGDDVTALGASDRLEAQLWLYFAASLCDIVGKSRDWCTSQIKYRVSAGF